MLPPPFGPKVSLPTPLDLDAARQRILERIPSPQAVERIPVDQALDRVAAEDCLARTDLPPFNASAMDGYAFRWQSGLKQLSVVGASLAGHPFADPIADGEAVRITTGAALPADCGHGGHPRGLFIERRRPHLEPSAQPGKQRAPTRSRSAQGEFCRSTGAAG